jgi:hypothetical protein
VNGVSFGGIGQRGFGTTSGGSLKSTDTERLQPDASDTVGEGKGWEVWKKP